MENPMSDLAFKSVIELLTDFRTGDLRPSQVIELYLTRIKKIDCKLGAFQTVYAEESQQAAEMADKLYRDKGDVGIFQGIPFALKDIVDIQGRVTTGGSMVMRSRVSKDTATIARRLLSAGGILIGKTKTVEVAMGAWGTNEHMGTPWNPWDMATARTPGGSSSGSGVSVAAGMVSCAVGTDTGGSVRGAAALGGIVGMKNS